MSTARSPRDSTLPNSALGAAARSRALENQAALTIAHIRSSEDNQTPPAPLVDPERQDQLPLPADISPKAQNALIALARLLGREAAREWLRGEPDD